MNLIFNKLKVAYELSTDAELAKKLEIKPSTLSMHRKRGTIDINSILNTCKGIDFNWLFDHNKKLIELHNEGHSEAAENTEMFAQGDFVNELLSLRKRIGTLENEIVALQKRLASKSRY